jgi:hypothetical protein
MSLFLASRRGPLTRLDLEEVERLLKDPTLLHPLIEEAMAFTHERRCDVLAKPFNALVVAKRLKCSC